MEKERQELLGVHCEATIDGYTDFIFLNRFGQPQHQSTLNKAIRRIIRDCNDEQFLKTENPEVLLPHFSCHSLRHRAVYNYRTYMNLLVEDGLDAEVQAQAEQICGTYLGTSDFYTSSKTQRALDRERLTDATMLIVYSLTALFGIIGISSAAVAILNSLYQRRKEFAMLRSVGLDRKGLDRLLHIEGFFLGGKPLVIGLPILFLIVAVLMWMQDVTFMEFIQVFPLLGLAAYIVLVLMVISGIYRAASRRIRRDIIVEALKDENV